MPNLDKDKPSVLPVTGGGALLVGAPRFAESIVSTFRKLAEVVGIPYLECEDEAKKVNKGPSCSLDVPKALERLGKEPIIGMYFHIPSLNLVLVTKNDKIGIRSAFLCLGVVKLITELHSRKHP